MKVWREHIADYLADRLTPEDRTAFETQLRVDSELHANFERAKSIDQAFDVLASDQLRSEAFEVRHSIKQKRRMRTIAGIAAAFALITFAYIGYTSTHVNPEAIYAEFYQAPLSPYQRGGADPIRSSLVRGIDLFHEGQFEQCKLVLATVTGDERDISSYFISHALLAQDSTEMARVMFEELARESKTYHDKAQWFAMLSMLKAGDMKQARARLSEITVNPDHEYFAKATALALRL